MIDNQEVVQASYGVYWLLCLFAFGRYVALGSTVLLGTGMVLYVLGDFLCSIVSGECDPLGLSRHSIVASDDLR